MRAAPEVGDRERRLADIAAVDSDPRTIRCRADRDAARSRDGIGVGGLGHCAAELGCSRGREAPAAGGTGGGSARAGAAAAAPARSRRGRRRGPARRRVTSPHPAAGSVFSRTSVSDAVERRGILNRRAALGLAEPITAGESKRDADQQRQR